MSEATLFHLRGRIEAVRIQGFRSLRDVSLDLPPLAVLIGANGTGKSNFLRFFEMLGWMLRARNLQEFITKHGGGDDQCFQGNRATPRIAAEISIHTQTGRNDYRVEWGHGAGDRLVVLSEAYRYRRFDMASDAQWTTIPLAGFESALPEQTNATAKTICHLLRQCVVYQFHDTSLQAPIHLCWSVDDAARLRSHGGNLAPVLLALREAHPGHYRWIVESIRRVLPMFDDFVLEPAGGKVLLQWRSLKGEKIFGPHLTSDGSLRLFCLMTLLNLPDDQLPDVVMIDEPELGLHPHAISLVAEMVRQLSLRRQVILATQSPWLVDCFALDQIIVAELDEQGGTGLRMLDADSYRDWLEDGYLPSDIWLRAPIGESV